MAKNSLHIGKGFDLPLDLVTSTQAILARKRSGKSYTASVQAEEMLAAGQQIGVIDPTGAWWGLRASADGTDAGFPIVVFGGDHEDAPLDSRAGKAMAAAFVEHGFSAIFDIGNFSTEGQLQFVSDFCAELLRINREALHLFMDEADTFAPQTPRSVAANKCLGTVSRLVKQGGIRGVGFTMITQRAASINWDILSQIDLLTILRMSAPHDVDPVVKWLQSETTKEFAAEVKAALPALTVGTAFFASAPLKIAQRVEVRARRTFNSGATPKPGERRAEPKVLASVDIERLGAEIAASVKEAKENSVDALRARIAELEAAPRQDTEKTMELIQQIEELREKAAEADRLRELLEKVERIRSMDADMKVKVVERLRSVTSAIDSAIEALEQQSDENIMAELPPRETQPIVMRVLDSVTPRKASMPADTNSPDATPVAIADGVNGPQQRILNAMATLHAIRGARVTLEWIACTAGTTPRARGFEENIRQLKAKGLVDGIRLTPAGAAIATTDATRPTFHAVLERLAKSLSQPQTHILNVVKRKPMSAAELAAEVGTTERARGFEENIRKLRSRDLLILRQGAYRCVDWLNALP